MFRVFAGALGRDSEEFPGPRRLPAQAAPSRWLAGRAQVAGLRRGYGEYFAVEDLVWGLFMDEHVRELEGRSPEIQCDRPERASGLAI